MKNVLLFGNRWGSRRRGGRRCRSRGYGGWRRCGCCAAFHANRDRLSPQSHVLFLERIEIGKQLHRDLILAFIRTGPVSNVFVPLIPTSSSCLKSAEGGYLCQPFSSSKEGPVTRSKLPRPEILAVTVTGSPTLMLFGFASPVIVKLPTAPPKLGGALGGNAFTSMFTRSAFSLTSRGTLPSARDH